MTETVRTRITAVAALITLIAALTCSADATPIRPDLKKILTQPPEAAMKFAPARAGWNGPEMQPPAAQASAALTFSQVAVAQAVRDSLRKAAIPDPRAVAAIVAAIVLLRKVRQLRPA